MRRTLTADVAIIMATLIISFAAFAYAALFFFSFTLRYYITLLCHDADYFAASYFSLMLLLLIIMLIYFRVLSPR